MANEVTSVNDRTLFKAVRALTKGEFMPFDKAQDTIERLMDEGFLIREPAEKVTRDGANKQPQGATTELKPTN